MKTKKFTVTEHLVFNIPFEEELIIANEYVNLYCTDVTSLPANMTILRTLNVEKTKIAELPEGLKVGKNLYIRNTTIKELPSDLLVAGYIYADPNQLEYIPEHLEGKVIYE